MKREFSEQDLLKLTSTLMIDFLKQHEEHDTNPCGWTLGAIINFCRLWIKSNVDMEG